MSKVGHRVEVGTARRVEVGGRVEGRSPRVEATGQPQFSKKLVDHGLASLYIGPIKMSVAKKKRRMVQLGLSLPPPAMKHGGAREGAGRKRSTNEQPHREREKFKKRCPVPIVADHAEDEAGYQESASARCVSKD